MGWASDALVVLRQLQGFGGHRVSWPVLGSLVTHRLQVLWMTSNPLQDELRRQKQKVKRMEAVIEPELMEKLMIQPVDDRIRQRDAPERYQISGEAELRDAFSDAQLDDAAR